jgi:type II secretory ATPase GspE/PulE/Tfp pilus assembly ATPase PilB-like protein
MTGYRGRTGIYELLLVDDAIRAALARNVAAGVTSMEEVLRVTREGTE